MKIKLHGIKNIYIKGEFIKLDALLKFQSIASTGGEAKYLIQSEEIFVNGEPCTIRGKKIKLGDIVRYDDKVLHIKRKNI